MPLRRRLLDQDLLAELENRERTRDEQQDQDEDEDEEAAHAHWPGALLVVGGPGNPFRTAREGVERREKRSRRIAPCSIPSKWAGLPDEVDGAEGSHVVTLCGLEGRRGCCRPGFGKKA